MTEPSDGWEAMADIGRLGLETAAAVVERILDLSRPATDLSVPLLTPTGDGDAARRLRSDAERLIDLYAEWTRSLVDRAIDVAAEGRHNEVLVVGPVAPGAVTESTAWLHVLDGPLGPGAHLKATDLTSGGGATLPADSVRLEPTVLDPDASGPSHEVRVRVDVPAHTQPGRYHGHLLVAGLADVALPLRVEVAAL
ncbi:MAG: hypothetical protein ACYDH6_21145 [Acidimicrobiales bacterium]